TSRPPKRVISQKHKDTKTRRPLESRVCCSHCCGCHFWYRRSTVGKAANSRHGPVHGFKHLHNSQAGSSVIYGRTAIQDAINEILSLDRQCFGVLNAWDPKVACPITNPEVMRAVAIRTLNALIVDFDLFVSLEIIPDEHFLFSANQRGAHFNRGKP